MRTFDPSRLTEFQDIADARVALATELALHHHDRKHIRDMIIALDDMVAKGETSVFLICSDDSEDEVLVGCDGNYRSTIDLELMWPLVGGRDSPLRFISFGSTATRSKPSSALPTPVPVQSSDAGRPDRSWWFGSIWPFNPAGRASRVLPGSRRKQQTPAISTD
jgi:hypothetical protein